MSKPYDFDKPSKLGSELTPQERREVLARYVHRYTRDHKPTWARTMNRAEGKPYPVQYASDADWLAHTRFMVDDKGRALVGYACHGQPTWPDNPELRGGMPCVETCENV